MDLAYCSTGHAQKRDLRMTNIVLRIYFIRWMDEWMDRWMDRWKDEWMDG